MEMCIVTERIPLEKFKTMTVGSLREYVRTYGTKLVDIKIEDNEVILTIESPVTWMIWLLHPCKKVQYRYV